MKAVIRYSLAAVLAVAFCVGVAFLYRSVRQETARIVCGRLDVHFADSLRFVGEQDIRDYLDERYGAYIGERMDSVQLAQIEDILESRSAVSRCEAWTTDDGVLHLEITQRAPVLRFMRSEQDGFYVDEAATSSRCTRPSPPPCPWSRAPSPWTSPRTIRAKPRTSGSVRGSPACWR